MGYYQEILKYAFQEVPVVASGITFIKAESTDLNTDFGEDVTTSYTITGIASGDFILGFASDAAGVAPDIPTGVTQIYSVNLLHNSAAFYDFSTGTSITFNNMDPDIHYSFIVFRNVNSTTPLDVSVTTPTNSGNVNTITPPSVTTVTNGCMIVIFLTVEDEANLVGNVTFDSSYTKSEEEYRANPDSYNLVAHKLQSTAGTETPSAFSWTPVDEAHTTTIALRPT